MKKLELKNVKGSYDYESKEQILRNYISDTLRKVNEENSKYYIEELKKDEEKTKMKLKKIMQTIDTSEKAIGVILLEKEKTKTKINPIIWVKTIDTLYYETACGSGSLATAIYKNYIEEIENLEIIQPSGYSININLNKKQEFIENTIITGIVIEEE